MGFASFIDDWCASSESGAVKLLICEFNDLIRFCIVFLGCSPWCAVRQGTHNVRARCADGQEHASESFQPPRTYLYGSYPLKSSLNQRVGHLHNWIEFSCKCTSDSLSLTIWSGDSAQMIWLCRLSCSSESMRKARLFPTGKLSQVCT